MLDKIYEQMQQDPDKFFFKVTVGISIFALSAIVLAVGALVVIAIKLL